MTPVLIRSSGLGLTLERQTIKINIMKNKYLVITLFLLLLNREAKSQLVYSTSKGEATFFSKAPIEDIDAHSQQLSSFINTSNNEIAFVIPIRSFHFKKALMEEHFNEKYIDSDKYPNATYKGKINEKIDFTKDGSYRVTSTGKFTIHGVEKQRTDTATLVILANQFTLSGSFDVSLKDHHIEIPTLLFKNIAEIIKVNFNAIYSPYQKDEKK